VEDFKDDIHLGVLIRVLWALNASFTSNREECGVRGNGYGWLALRDVMILDQSGSIGTCNGRASVTLNFLAHSSI
jgi:hypothetical protein